MSCIFTNDNDVEIKLLENHTFSNIFSKRNNHEVLFRRIHSYLINKNIIKKNIIDLGAWIGDNSVPWAKQIEGIVYAIDPSPDNILFICVMCQLNNIKNVTTIQKAISDRNEILYTDESLHHCSFNNVNGRTNVNAYSLDYLHAVNLIDDIGYIHLDVEGLEEKVINGASLIIEKFRPIITFEQHLTVDNYKSLSDYLANKNYIVYLINEILPGCNHDCRNLMAFPEELNINIMDIHTHLNQKVLLLVSKPQKKHCIYSATIYGEYFGTTQYHNVIAVKHTDKEDTYLFAVHDDNHTKFIAINGQEEWIDGRYLLGTVDIEDSETVINAYESAQGFIKDKNKYNIKNIKYSYGCKNNS